MSRMLIIEKNLNTRQALSSALNKQGFETSTADSFPEAIRLMQESALNGVFVSVDQSDLEGMEVLCLMSEALPTVVFHTSTGEWPFHLPVMGQERLFFKTEKLVSVLESSGQKPKFLATNRV